MANNNLYTRGKNNSGQLGDGTNTNSNIPVQIDISDVTAVAGGFYHSMALKSDQVVWTFGRNDYGHLGYGTNTTSNIPLHTSDIADVAVTSACEYHSLAIID